MSPDPTEVLDYLEWDFGMYTDRPIPSEGFATVRGFSIDPPKETGQRGGPGCVDQTEVVPENTVLVRGESRDGTYLLVLYWFLVRPLLRQCDDPRVNYGSCQLSPKFSSTNGSTLYDGS